MHNIDLILTLTSSFIAALALGYLTHRIGLSPIVGYLLAGVVVGPATPGFVANQHLAEQMAEIGVILLMFGVGLHFHIEELLAVRRIAIPGAIGQSLFATALGAMVAHSFNWSWTEGIVFGLAISVASTVVLTRVLTDHRDLHSPTGHIAIGWLVVEDLLTVVVLVLLPAIYGTAKVNPAQLPLVLLWAAVKIGLLVAFTLVFGQRIIPRLLEHIAATRSRELFTLTVLAVALGIAVGSAKIFGVSMALGAFLAGMVVGRSEFSLRAASEALPMRDAFAVLFFVSVGMLFDPAAVLKSPGLIAATCGIILVGKPWAALVIAMSLRYPLRTSLSVAVALAQIGEFSFILAVMGRELNVLPPEATSTLVIASIISITLNPLLYKSVGPVSRLVSRLGPSGAKSSKPGTKYEAGEEAASPRHHAILIGYGPVGRTLTRLLRQNDLEPTIIELNLDTIRNLRREGIDAVYGDAAIRDTLVMAGAVEAGSLILSASTFSESEAVIRLARDLNPDIQILARANYVRDMARLRAAGASQVFSGEGEVALSLIEAVLRPLGATAEQIDREREWFRKDFLGVDTNSIAIQTLERDLAGLVPIEGLAAGDGAEQPGGSTPEDTDTNTAVGGAESPR